MSKKKDPMALFEVLSKQDNPESATKVPAWMKRKAAEPAQGDAPEVPQDAETEAIQDETDGDYIAEPPPAPAAEELQELVEADEIDEAADEYDEEIDEDLPEEDDLDDIDETPEAHEAEQDPADALDELDDEELDDEDDITEYDADELPEEDVEEFSAETERAAADPTPQVEAVTPPKLPAEIPPAIPEPAASPAEPWLDMSDQRVRLSLPILTAAIAAGCILVALVAAFTIGWLAAPGPSPKEATLGDAAVSAPVDTQGPPPLNSQNRPAMVATTTGQRSPDRQYLIIETLRGASQDDLNEADRIVAFVAQRGLPADIQLTGRNTNPRYVVWSLQGFLDRESPEAKAFVEKVQGVGEAYFERYGTYRFRQEREGRPQPFWVSGKQEKQ